MADFAYRLMTADDAPAVSALVLSVFDQFIAPEYTPQGIDEFRKYAGAAALTRRAAEDHFVVVATAVPSAAPTMTEAPLVGMIEMRQNNHVALLFVSTDCQRRGVARALLTRALEEARARGGEPERVTVNSSRYGVPAYESLGFLQTGPERAVNGIVFIPMAMRLDG